MIIKYQKIARYVLFCTLNNAQHELSNSYEQIVGGFLFAELVSGREFCKLVTDIDTVD